MKMQQAQTYPIDSKFLVCIVGLCVHDCAPVEKKSRTRNRKYRFWIWKTLQGYKINIILSGWSWNRFAVFAFTGYDWVLENSLLSSVMPVTSVHVRHTLYICLDGDGENRGQTFVYFHAPFNFSPAGRRRLARACGFWTKSSGRGASRIVIFFFFQHSS